MPKREILRDPLEFAWLFDAAAVRRDVGQPETAIQALQQTAPHQKTRVSLEERYDLREAVVDAIESLEPDEVWLINALLFERLSLRDAEYILGIPKTTVARKRDKVLAKLRQMLEDNPYVREHIYGEST